WAGVRADIQIVAWLLRARGLHYRSCLLHGVDDIRIGGAPAQIAAHIFTNVRVVLGVTFIDAADRRHDLARRAIAALKSVMLDEGLLHRMQFAVVGDAFDSGHVVTLRGDG